MLYEWAEIESPEEAMATLNHIKYQSLKSSLLAGRGSLTLVILATLEAEIMRTAVRSQPRANNS
jgi:hypothetical protein